MDNKKYTFEESNEKHPGLCVMQNGKEADAVIPLAAFVGKIKDAQELINAQESQFFAFTAEHFESAETYNNYIELTRKFNAQLSDFAIRLKSKGGAITIPDSKYFLGRYRETVNAINSGKRSKESARRDLTKEFYQALTTSIEKNIESARPFGITVPTPKNDKIKD